MVFIADDGSERHLSAHELFPEDGRLPWPIYEALTGGFGEEHSADVLAREQPFAPPRAYRIKVRVEAEPLTSEETEALLRARARRNAEWYPRAGSDG